MSVSGKRIREVAEKNKKIIKEKGTAELARILVKTDEFKEYEDRIPTLSRIIRDWSDIRKVDVKPKYQKILLKLVDLYPTDAIEATALKASLQIPLGISTLRRYVAQVKQFGRIL